MPAAGDPEENGTLKPALWHRLRPGSDQPKPALMDRLRLAVLKPEDPDAPQRSRGAYELSGEELVAEEKRANDKERAIGLLAGPLAMLIAFLVIHELVVHDPAAPSRLHVNLSTYSGLFIVLVILSFGITGMALWRKRLYLGIVTSLYGLAIFNLDYWGFGVPFVLVGAWYLVRTYRLHRNLRVSTTPAADGGPVQSRPASSKRYTPPAKTRSKRGAG
ncbi:MAG TPA: hypothetical protein VEJ84_08525 [Acidimicrobiales bacterium]|nr:hypothetical protein [Acidimicrobiales bacterium]